MAGCSIVSPGCHKCYAATMAKRLAAMGQHKYAGLTDRNGQWTGKINYSATDLMAPLTWRKPRRVFVNSMSDLFHEQIPDSWIDSVFSVMAMTPRHTYQVLTKRAERLSAYMNSVGLLERIKNGIAANFIDTIHPQWPLPHVHLGVSVEDQKRANQRISFLAETPAAIRFLSCEPLLGRIQLPDISRSVHWIIVSGESGPGSRNCDINWIRSLVDQCRRANVKCFVKQLGSKPVGDWGDNPPMVHVTHAGGRVSREFSQYKNGRWKLRDKKGGNITEFPQDLRIREFPKELSST